ncbi:Bud site selection protein bud4 [Allomyces javanicus]|nr:Bud site selection protein bud4 [Allomyces javanicus]
MSSVGSAWFAALRAGDHAVVVDLLNAHPELLDVQSPDPTPFDPDLVAEATQLMGPDTTRMNAVQAALMSLDADSDDGDEAEHRERAARRRATILHLIEASTLVQLRARWGAQNTTLHLASFLGENDIIAALLAKGAPASPRNDLGLAPIDLTTDDATRAAFRAALPKSPQKRIVTGPLKSSAASSATGSPGISRRNSISVAPVTPAQVDLSEVVARQEEAASPAPSVAPEVVDEKPLTFKGKYVTPADEIEAPLPKINLRRSRASATATGTGGAKPVTSRRRVIGVDLAAFDEVLGDPKPATAASDEALARSTSNAVDRIDSGTVGSAENLVARSKDAPADEKAAVVGKTGSKISETLAALASSSVPVVKEDLAAQADELFIPLQKRKARFPTLANGEPAASASPVVVAHVRPASPRSWGESTVNGATKGAVPVPAKSAAPPSPIKAAAAASPVVAQTKPAAVVTPAPTAAAPAPAPAAVTPWGPKVQPKGHSRASSITAAPADPASSTSKPTIAADGSSSRNPQLYIDHIGVDFGQARAAFMQRIKNNPNVPKVPTKMADLATLATPSAAAAQVRRPAIKKEEAEEGGDGQQPKSRLADIKRQHTKADSGTWRSLTSRSVSSECVKSGPAPVVGAVQEAPVEEEEVPEQVVQEVAPEEQEPETVEEVAEPEPPAPAEVEEEEQILEAEADPVPEPEEPANDVSAADADDSQAASSSTNLLPPLPTLDFDFSLDDLAPSLMYMLDRPRSPSPPPPTVREDAPTKLGSTLETFPTLAHSTTTDATSDQVSDLSQTLRTEDARSTMTADDDLDLVEDPNAAIEVTTHFGGAPIPKIARRATISIAATQPTPAPAAAPQLPPRRGSMSASMDAPVTSAAARRASFSVGSVPAPGPRAASPLGSSPLKPKKSVSFRPTRPGSVATSGSSSGAVVEDGTLMVKVCKVSGLEWVLSGRQMTHVFVTVTKRDAAVFASKPFLVMSDSVGIGDEAPIHVTANDTLQVNVCLRYEQRQQAKTGFLASANRLFQAGKRADAAGDTVRDIREEIVATAPIPVALVLPRARGVLHAMTLVSTTGRPVTVDVGALFLPSITPAAMPFRTLRDAVDQLARLHVLHSEIQCEGTLAQHGGDTRHWKRRYFRLVGWKLMPFSDAMVPRDALDLAQCTGMAKGVDLVARDPGHHLASVPRSFVLQFKNGEGVCFACDSDESFAQWTDGIEGMLEMWPGEAMMQLVANCST